jgi:hypothetical protein
VLRGGAEGKIMLKTGASYQPELIELMKTALDEAASALPLAKQTSAMKVKLASRILSGAVRGVRDPIQLRIDALMEINEVEDELHRSYAQLRRLRQRVERAETAQSAFPQEADDSIVDADGPRTASCVGRGNPK